MAEDETTGPGTYWLTARQPHRLLGYSGLGVRHDSAADPYDTMPDSTAAKLSVRPEGAPAARDAYTAMRSAIRSLPSTVPVEFSAGDKVSEKTGGAECGVLCHTAVVDIALTNRMAEESVTARYEIELKAPNPDVHHFWDMDLGSCTVRLPAARPGTTVRGACTVAGAALRKAVDEATDEHGFVHLRLKTEATRTRFYVTGPSHSEDLLKELDSHTGHVLGTG
ncbi:hypothetical protein AB0L74_19140 [Streptomyces sp. NPDC052020]|uniref:hypothetical protein n=1 Tax=Streptomyces sp. NPDC052020 TaxID=3155677 RepID=UPI0034425315